MKYCTNCGAENTKKICHSCGAKNNKAHKFCGYCGGEIKENAVICTECGKSIKPTAKDKIFYIIGWVFSLFFVFLSTASFGTSDYLSIVLCLIAALLSTPIVGNLFKKVIKSKFATVIRIVLVVVCFICVLEFGADVSFEIYQEQATAAAEVVFHEEVNLKNEASFVINGSKVTYETEDYKKKVDYAADTYKTYPNVRLVTVVIDYSAENGFGGTNRDTYTVKLLFNTETGKYYRVDDMSVIG